MANPQDTMSQLWQVVAVGAGFPGGSEVKNPPANAGDVGPIPGSGRSLEKDMATHSSILAWRILPGEPAGLQATLILLG